MNVDSFISFLVQSPWLFLTGLILVLGVAFADVFSEKPGQTSRPGSGRTRPR
jgi:hypothetical protein